MTSRQPTVNHTTKKHKQYKRRTPWQTSTKYLDEDEQLRKRKSSLHHENKYFLKRWAWCRDIKALKSKVDNSKRKGESRRFLSPISGWEIMPLCLQAVNPFKWPFTLTGKLEAGSCVDDLCWSTERPSKIVIGLKLACLLWTTALEIQSGDC